MKHTLFHDVDNQRDVTLIRACSIIEHAMRDPLAHVTFTIDDDDAFVNVTTCDVMLICTTRDANARDALATLCNVVAHSYHHSRFNCDDVFAMLCDDANNVNRD